MANFGLRFETMQILMKVTNEATVGDLVHVISGAHEFTDVLLRSGEKGLYEEVREHEDIRFPPGSIENVADKISVILQAELAGLPLYEMLKDVGRKLSVNPKADANLIMDHAPKITRALLQVVTEKRYGATARNVFELGSAWENTPAELRQINGIGPSYMQTLAQAKIVTIDDLAQANVNRVQLLLNRTPTQVQKLIQEARRFPRFNISVKEIEYKIIQQKGVESNVEILVELRHPKKEIKKLFLKDADSKPYHLAALITTTNKESRTCFFVRTKIESTLKGPQNVQQKVLLTRPDEQIILIVACDALAGGVNEIRLKSMCPRHKYPPVDTPADINEPSDRLSVLRGEESASISARDLSEGGASEQNSRSSLTGSKILAQIDSCCGGYNDEFRSRTSMIEADDDTLNLMATRKAVKRPYKDKATKMQEAREAKAEEIKMNAKIERYNEKCRAEKKAKADAEEKRRAAESDSVKKELTRNSAAHRRKVDSSKEESSEGEDSLDDVPLFIRKKFRPDDWNYGTQHVSDKTPVSDRAARRNTPPRQVRNGNEPSLLQSDLESEHDSQRKPTPLGRIQAASKQVYTVLDTESEGEGELSVDSREEDEEDEVGWETIRSGTAAYNNEDSARTEYSQEVGEGYGDNGMDSYLDWGHQDTYPAEESGSYEQAHGAESTLHAKWYQPEEKQEEEEEGKDEENKKQNPWKEAVEERESTFDTTIGITAQSGSYDAREYTHVDRVAGQGRAHKYSCSLPFSSNMSARDDALTYADSSAALLPDIESDDFDPDYLEELLTNYD
ncbi:hypothetical protein CBS101457_001502 [Exobasidium rhododendri]|nr:hypothetical protein CBS101457_001502 [Exobasidium rhododendri]